MVADRVKPHRHLCNVLLCTLYRRYAVLKRCEHAQFSIPGNCRYRTEYRLVVLGLLYAMYMYGVCMVQLSLRELSHESGTVIYLV